MLNQTAVWGLKFKIFLFLICYYFLLQKASKWVKHSNGFLSGIEGKDRWNCSFFYSVRERLFIKLLSVITLENAQVSSSCVWLDLNLFVMPWTKIYLVKVLSKIKPVARQNFVRLYFFKVLLLEKAVRWRWSVKKAALKNFAKFTEKNL